MKQKNIWLVEQYFTKLLHTRINLPIRCKISMANEKIPAVNMSSETVRRRPRRLWTSTTKNRAGISTKPEKNMLR